MPRNTSPVSGAATAVLVLLLPLWVVGCRVIPPTVGEGTWDGTVVPVHLRSGDGADVHALALRIEAGAPLSQGRSEVPSCHFLAVFTDGRGRVFPGDGYPESGLPARVTGSIHNRAPMRDRKGVDVVTTSPEKGRALAPLRATHWTIIGPCVRTLLPRAAGMTRGGTGE